MRRTILLLVFSPPLSVAKRYLVEMRNGTNPNSDFVGNDKTENALEFTESDPSPNGGNDYTGSGDKLFDCRLLAILRCV